MSAKLVTLLCFIAVSVALVSAIPARNRRKYNSKLIYSAIIRSQIVANTFLK